MNIQVLLSSGETDGWEDVVDAQADGGYLLVLGAFDPDPEVKTITVRTEIPNDNPELPPTVKLEPFTLVAMYAPGMWMKVEFDG